MMSPFDDRLLEERKPQYEELTTMLRQAYRKPVQVAPERRAQALQRARERLGFTDTDAESPGMMNSVPFSVLPLKSIPRRQRFFRLTMLIAAVLMVGVLIGASLLVFQVRPPSAATPNDSAEHLITAQTQAQGLVATLQIPRGPYFLSEVIEVDFTLANHSRNTYYINNEFVQKDCATFLSGSDAMGIKITGNSKLADTTLQRALSVFTCPPTMGFELQPTRTLSLPSDIALTTSGHVTLSPELENPSPITVYDPLAGKWPSIQINVQKEVPPNRVITGKQSGKQVTIIAPPSAGSLLFYAVFMRCSDGGTETDYEGHLKTMTLSQPQCSSNIPGIVGDWVYAVGAPGYSVFVGSVKN